MKLSKVSNSLYQDSAPYLGLGIQLAAGIIVFYFLGSWADGKLHTTPWLMVTGVTMGAVGGFIKFFKTAADLAKMESKQKENGTT